jgi:hypothetical protein
MDRVERGDQAASTRRTASPNVVGNVDAGAGSTWGAGSGLGAGFGAVAGPAAVPADLPGDRRRITADPGRDLGELQTLGQAREISFGLSKVNNFRTAGSCPHRKPRSSASIS